MKAGYFFLKDSRNGKNISIVLFHKLNKKLNVFHAINIANSFLPMKQYSLKSLGKKATKKQVKDFMSVELYYTYHPEEFYNLVNHCKFHCNRTTKTRYLALMDFVGLPKKRFSRFEN
ncbi:MAG: hypothetical protein WC011_02460 [Candidatus Paceibacterota bacterium]